MLKINFMCKSACNIISMHINHSNQLVFKFFMLSSASAHALINWQSWVLCSTELVLANSLVAHWSLATTTSQDCNTEDCNGQFSRLWAYPEATGCLPISVVGIGLLCWASLLAFVGNKPLVGGPASVASLGFPLSGGRDLGSLPPAPGCGSRMPPWVLSYWIK